MGGFGGKSGGPQSGSPDKGLDNLGRKSRALGEPWKGRRSRPRPLSSRGNLTRLGMKKGQAWVGVWKWYQRSWKKNI